MYKDAPQSAINCGKQEKVTTVNDMPCHFNAQYIYATAEKVVGSMVMNSLCTAAVTSG